MATVSGTDRLRDLHAFDDTKAGVKGLVDAGVTTVPYFFRHHPDPLPVAAPSEAASAIPLIDLAKADVDRGRVVAEVRAAAETVGFFQVVNHGVAGELMEEMLAAVRRFNEEPLEAKVPYYTRDVASKVRFSSNFDLFRSPAANWRDTMFVEMFPEVPSPEEIPPPCRGVLEEYAAAVRRLGERLFELLSEALGLPVGYLGRDAGCMDGLSLSVAAHYYPACPEPEATMGATKHSDPSFLTVLLQDTSGGLQAVLPRPPEERWVDVPPVAGALLVNVGGVLLPPRVRVDEAVRPGRRRRRRGAGGGGVQEHDGGGVPGALQREGARRAVGAGPLQDSGGGGVSSSSTTAFDNNKAGVKGLVDTGVTTIPYFFRHHPDPLPIAAPSKAAAAVLVIDLAKGDVDRGHVVSQVVNHGVAGELMDAMLAAVRRFNEQPAGGVVAFRSPPQPPPAPFQASFSRSCEPYRVLTTPPVLTTRVRPHMATVSGTDRLRDLHAFDDTKAGVKGLVDAGVTTVPYFFRHHPDPLPVAAPSEAASAIPLIDLAKADVDRGRVVAEVRAAAETVGFFQVVNHGVAGELMDEMLAAVRRFNEEPLEAKVPYYTRDVASKVRFSSNFDLFRSPAANWRDTMFVEMFPEVPSPEEIPPPCRGALGLPPGYLAEHAGCMDGMSMVAQYYPPCPEPEKTMGTTRHSDPSFLTVLLQDESGGLQAVLPRPPEERWVDVPPVAGALVVNVGDLLQLVSNGRLRSMEHRVLPTGAAGPARVSVACFFRHAYASTRSCVPVVVGGGGARAAAVYRSTTAGEFLAHYNGKGLDGRSALDHFRLPAAASSPPPPL
uniref:Fe2OG dioxygenase domain-containing protein n=1 Tax=Oryza nivara TaxID=4536 RepID=A0A0E0HQN7_ORYNI